VLAGFTRAHAGPGETEIVRIHMPSRAFARWDDAESGWVHPRGTYRIEVGSSSRDLRLRSDIEIG
jgi:beta-glucosidase